MTPRPPRLSAVLMSLALGCALAAGPARSALAAPPAATGPEAKVLDVYNWSDYIADDTLKNFEKETGIKVNYDTYDSNEIPHGKLIAGKTGYDIVVPSAHFAKMQLEAGLYRKLDRGSLSNWGNLDPTSCTGDINIARSRAIAAKNGNDIVAFVPKSGATRFFDSMAIPADAPHPRNALLFINYILRPDVAAALTNKVYYANPNEASLKLVRKDIAGNDSIFVKPDEMARMAVPDTLPQDAKRIQTRAFTGFKTGG